MYTVRELQAMKLKDLLKLEEELQGAIKQRKTTEAREVREEIAELAKRRGFNLDEVFGKRLQPAGGYKQTMSVKYRNPDNDRETWTGRGRKPNWLMTKIDRGAKVDDFRI